MEALVVIGLVSAIVQFVDSGTKVIAQLDKFRSRHDELPVVFRDIGVQLPLLLSDLKQTKDECNRGEIDVDAQKAVLAVVQRCHTHIQVCMHSISVTVPKRQLASLHLMSLLHWTSHLEDHVLSSYRSWTRYCGRQYLTHLIPHGDSPRKPC